MLATTKARAHARASVAGTTLLTCLVGLLAACQQKEPQFTLLPASETGIAFANTITESDSINPISMLNVYNGGGIAAGDFNGDGKLDLYFTGNQVSSTLYLNKGGFKFDDVTKTANVSGAGHWNAGAAVVDLNQDGRLDLYVCAGQTNDPNTRRNQLYVNQGNNAAGVPTFREMAADYGLADTTSTTQAAFFDFDRDGDLDVYLLVDYVTPEVAPNKFHQKITDGSTPNQDQFYRNDWDSAKGHAVFTNITREAGIFGEGFGLGVKVCDLNHDGWPDVLVTNDLITNDFAWINTGSGGKGGPAFVNKASQLFRHTSFTAMGTDVVDLNNDTRPDIVTMDMMADDYARRTQMDRPYTYNLYDVYQRFGYDHQYKRNTLQLNLGPTPGDSSNLPVFSEIAYQTDIAYTDWSWSPLVFDADQDGYRDLFVTNGYPRDLADNDFMQYRQEATDADTGRLALTQKMPQIKIGNYAFRNQGLREVGGLGFDDVSAEWAVNQPSYSNSAVYGDFDGDGDLDMVVNNINDPAFVYRNNQVEQGLDGHHYLTVSLKGTPQNPLGYGAEVEITTKQGKQVYDINPTRGYLAYQPAVAHFGLGEEESVQQVQVRWPDGRTSVLNNVPADQTVIVDAKTAIDQTITNVPDPLLADQTRALGLNMAHQETDYNDFDQQFLLTHKLSQPGPKVATGDLTGDGLDDIVVTGNQTTPALLLVQQRTGAFTQQPISVTVGANEGHAEPCALALFDADGDTDLDVLIGMSGYERVPMLPFVAPHLLLNDGKGNFAQADDALPSLRVVPGCLRPADFDHDGDMDLFIGGRVKPGYYPQPVSSYLLRNDSPRGGPVRYVDVTAQLAPGLKDIGLVCDAVWSDDAKSGYPSLLLVGEFMPLTVFNNEKGNLQLANAEQPNTPKGSWNCLQQGDLDGDGDLDLVAGNMGLNNMARPSETEPMRVYAADFNDDGRYDAIPTCYFRRDATSTERAEFPMFNRDDMIKQFLPIRRRFLRYADYGKATINEVLTEEERTQAIVREVNYAQTAWFENRGNGEYVPHALPQLAQSALIHGIDIRDIDGDRRPDILLVGNDYGNTHIEGRQDAFSGLVLLNKGKGQFVPQLPAESGFYVPGDAKSIAAFRTAAGKSAWVIGQNQGPLKVFVKR